VNIGVSTTLTKSNGSNQRGIAGGKSVFPGRANRAFSLCAVSCTSEVREEFVEAGVSRQVAIAYDGLLHWLAGCTFQVACWPRQTTGVPLDHVNWGC